MTQIDAVGVSASATNPRDQGAGETQALSFDFTPVLGATETIVSASAQLTREPNGTSYPAGLQGAASISGKTVIQTVTALVADSSCLLAVKAVGSSGNSWEMTLTINCPRGT